MKYLVPFLFISLIFNIFFICNKDERKQDASIPSKIKHDTVFITDTFKYDKPKLQIVTIKDTIYVLKDSVKTEGDSIILEREEKTYTDDSTYRAVISGYKPQLDTLMVYPKTYIIEKTKTVTIEKKRKFNIGLQVGSGYGIFNRKPDVYVGIGIQYNLW